MLRLEPKPKERCKVPIPSELREAMGEVVRLIKQAKRDPDINIDYDDAIQIGPICGGRYQKKPGLFDFSYYPKIEGSNARWDLMLHECDIEDMADGHMTEITLYVCKSPECGKKFNKSDGHCSCDYIKDPDYGKFEFPEAAEKLIRRGIPEIGQHSTRDDILNALGQPSELGGDVEDSVIGYIWPWIKYHRADCQLRFEFDKQDAIRNITILKKDWEPGK